MIKLSGLTSHLKKHKVRQVSALYTSMLVAMVVSIGVSVLNTRLLGLQSYGDYKFLLNLFTLAMTLISLGAFVTGGRLLGKEADESRKSSITGGLLLVAGLYSILLTGGFYVFAEYEEQIFNNQLGEAIRFFAPMLFVYPLSQMLEETFKGDNRIYSLAVLRVAPNLAYLVSIFVLSRFTEVDLYDALLLIFSCLAVVYVLALLYLKPELRHAAGTLPWLTGEIRSYGIPIYTGMLASIASTQFGSVMLAFYIDTASVGLFLLAGTMVLPLRMLSTSIGTTFYKSFITSQKIPGRVLAATLVISLFMLIVFNLLIEWVIGILYPAEFQATVGLSKLMSVGATLAGIGGVFNNYLCAQGYGKYSRNASFLMGLVNLVGYTVVTSVMGLYGAAITTVMASGVYLLALVYYYEKHKRIAGTGDAGIGRNVEP